jgi:hypothetical protein
VPICELAAQYEPPFAQTNPKDITMFDFNGVDPAKPNEAIPDGAFAKVIMTIRPGGLDGDSPVDRGLLAASRVEGSDVVQLDCEFTILEGQFARRKFWRRFVLSGGKVDEQGVSIGWKITKSAIRAILDSAHGLDPKDESQPAQARRRISGFYDLNNLTFVAKIATDDEGRSELDAAITRDRAEWSKVMAGENVPPKPGARRKATGQRPTSGTTAAPQPAWQQGGTSEASPPQSGAQAGSRGPAPAPMPAGSPKPQPPGTTAATSGQPVSPGSGAPRKPGPAWLNE